MAKTSVKTPRFRHNVNDPLLIALSLFDVDPTLTNGSYPVLLC